MPFPNEGAAHNVARDNHFMRIKHKGLRALAEQDHARELPQEWVPKLKRALTLPDGARRPSDLTSQPGYRLHPLKGDMAGMGSIRVSGNWRVVFRFKDNEAVDVDLVNCH